MRNQRHETARAPATRAVRAPCASHMSYSDLPRRNVRGRPSSNRASAVAKVIDLRKSRGSVALRGLAGARWFRDPAHDCAFGTQRGDTSSGKTYKVSDRWNESDDIHLGRSVRAGRANQGEHARRRPRAQSVIFQKSCSVHF
jgi:hypothetical protein